METLALVLLAALMVVISGITLAILRINFGYFWPVCLKRKWREFFFRPFGKFKEEELNELLNGRDRS